MKICISIVLLVVMSLECNAQDAKCFAKQRRLAEQGLRDDENFKEELHCADLCTGVYIMEEEACNNTDHCYYRRGQCVLKRIATPDEEDRMDIDEIGLEFLRNFTGGQPGARNLNLLGPPLSIEQIRAFFPGVSLCPKFPDSCSLSYTSAEDLEPPINIPYCQRIACRQDDPFLDTDPARCYSNPGCAFDHSLYVYRSVLSQGILLGVPVCHLAIRNEAFQRRAKEYMEEENAPWNPLLTNCFINQYREDIYGESRGCAMTRVFGELGYQAKRAGWKGISKRDCHVIDGCWMNDICIYPLPLSNIKTKASSNQFPTPFFFDLGRTECLPFNNNLTNGDFLDAYHSCLSAGCSLDVDRETLMQHLYGVSTTYLPPHLQPQYWTMALLGQIQAHNWKDIADRLIGDNKNSPSNILSEILPANVLGASHLGGGGVQLLPFTLAINISGTSSLQSSFTTFGSFGQFGNFKPPGSSVTARGHAPGNGPANTANLNLGNFGSLINPQRIGSREGQFLQQQLSGAGPSTSTKPRTLELGPSPPPFCPYETTQWPGFPPLLGSFQDCCEPILCYLPKDKLRNARSEIASYDTDWTSWGPCSKTCGNGQQIRRKFCIGDKCGEAEEEKQPCNPEPCPIERPFGRSTTLSPWTEFSSCSATCGGGFRSRTRSCLGQPPCGGSLKDTVPCRTGRCHTFRKTQWSRCSSTCGIGVQQRRTICVPGAYGCPENSDVSEERECETFCGRVVFVQSGCNIETCLITRTPTCLTNDRNEGHCRSQQMKIKTTPCNSGRCYCLRFPRNRYCSRRNRR